MNRRQICLLVFVSIAIVVAVGVRTTTGQGYSDPVVVPKVTSATATPAARTLEVRLTNRKSGRPQNYAWSVSIPLGGSVEVECHEWTQVRWFAVPLFGVPRNSFRRVISYDASEKGIAEPYDYIIRWHAENGGQGTTERGRIKTLRWPLTECSRAPRLLVAVTIKT